MPCLGSTHAEDDLVGMDDVELLTREFIEKVEVEALRTKAGGLALERFALAAHLRELGAETRRLRFEARLGEDPVAAMEGVEREIGKERRGEERHAEMAQDRALALAGDHARHLAQPWLTDGCRDGGN